MTVSLSNIKNPKLPSLIQVNTFPHPIPSKPFPHHSGPQLRSDSLVYDLQSGRGCPLFARLLICFFLLHLLFLSSSLIDHAASPFPESALGRKLRNENLKMVLRDWCYHIWHLHPLSGRHPSAGIASHGGAMVGSFQAPLNLANH